ncbi:PAS domain-containing sensor histidine kinase [Oscillatoria amoena NRMC-F 0135]|nr:PAS domain-containing sensor histidine kinase [Oscillatoria amoena NRMC-F 0135]
MTKNNSETVFTSPETLSEVFQNSAEGILMVDTRGIILLANKASDQMFGYTSGELIGKPLEVLLPQRYREQHPGHRASFHQAPSPRKMGVGRDLVACRKDGAEFPVEVSLSHHKVNDQLVIIAFIIDITERKKAEEAVKRSEEQLLLYAAELERKVRIRTDALNKSVEDLEKANRFLQEQIAERKKAEEEVKRALDRERELNELKSKFVSIASHEFRTPLSTVLSSASLVMQYKQKGDLTKIDKHIQRIKSSVSHLTNILNDFLSLGKLEEGRIEILKESIFLKEFLQEILDEMKPQLKESQTLKILTTGKERPVHTDQKVLRNILFNLISNASKYSEPGKPITINVTFWENHFEIAVVDKGIGIPKQDLKHLFERFFRASNAGQVQGTGLGLNIIKRYIELLNGEINFTSEEGKGSTFTVILPVT